MITPPVAPSTTALRVLLLERNDTEAAHIAKLLRDDGFETRIRRSESFEAFCTACREGGFDAIIAEFGPTPHEAWDALEVARRLRPGIPLIYFSPPGGEELAFDCLRLGAADFVLKAHPERLGSSIRRASSERLGFDDAMRRGERLFEGIAEANRLLLTSGRVTETLPAVLRSLGEAVETDRVAVFQIHPHPRTGQTATSLRAEWARESIPSLYGDLRLKDQPVSDLGPRSVMDRIGNGEPIEARVVDLVGPERRLLEEHGVISLLAFPIRVILDVWGYITFDQCHVARAWTPAERTALGTVAANIGQSIGRERDQAALTASEARYESLLSSLSEGVFHVDLEARWRFLNHPWQELTGYTVGECLGRRFAEYLDSDDAPAALEGFGRLISGHSDRVENEMRFRHRSGQTLWLRVNAQAQTDHNGRVSGVSGTLVDVTQRRLAQEALRASERKFAAVFASSSDALFLVDSSSNLIVECNPRAVEMFECTESRELIGTNCSSHQRRQLNAREMEDGLRLMAQGADWMLELQYLTKRGRNFWGQVAMTRMAPEALGITLVRITDITGLKRSEERLRASLGEKEMLLKEVYHRVKNNLQIISALLRMQARRVKDPIALEALENSISRVMAMSMVHEKLYQAQNLVSIDFLSFAQSLVGFLNQLTAGSRSPIVIDVSGTPLALSIDQAIPLGLVLNELVTNSLKYAFPDENRPGRVDIRIGMDGPNAARVTVTDDGVGLTGEVDLDTAAGLGFRIVRMLVEQLQGVLEIQTRPGLRISVRVPLPANRPAETPAR